MIKKFSFLDTLIFNALYSIPNYLQGIFTRRRLWVSFWTKTRVDGYAVRFIARKRRQYKSAYFFTRVGGQDTIVVLDHDAIRHVLANSPQPYADSASKRTGMSHFQPNALTISRGDDWKDRRRFNEAVLNTGHQVHQYAGHFLDIITSATDAMLDSAGGHLSWRHFDELFEQIASGIIFGLDPQAGRGMFDDLEKMMRESNRLFALKKSKYFDGFYDRIRTQLRSLASDSLAFLCKHTASTETTRVENQIPHWMFAMRDTLAANTARALALIVSHPEDEQRVRDELIWSEKPSPEAIGNLKYLEGCIQEGMRLWPTTPFLARELLSADVLAGAPVPAGTQILILNAFNHRDTESNADANTFTPEQWLNGPPNLPYNHLSSGAQACAGKDLVLFVSKSVIAAVLRKGRYALHRPALNPKKPVPPMYNYFRLEFRKLPQ